MGTELQNRVLYGHKSCVNALAFSSGDGHYMASAGDGMADQYMPRSVSNEVLQSDHIVRLWDLYREEVEITSAFSGPTVSRPEA